MTVCERCRSEIVDVLDSRRSGTTTRRRRRCMSCWWRWSTEEKSIRGSGEQGPAEATTGSGRGEQFHPPPVVDDSTKPATTGMGQNEPGSTTGMGLGGVGVGLGSDLGPEKAESGRELTSGSRSSSGSPLSNPGSDLPNDRGSTAPRAIAPRSHSANGIPWAPAAAAAAPAARAQAETRRGPARSANAPQRANGAAAGPVQPTSKDGDRLGLSPAIAPPRDRRPYFAAKTLPFLAVLNAYPRRDASHPAAQIWQELAETYPGGELALRDAILARFAGGMLARAPYYGPHATRPTLRTFLEERRWEDPESAPDEDRNARRPAADEDPDPYPELPDVAPGGLGR